MYKNLEAELARNGITRIDIAEVLQLNISTVSNKLTIPKRLKLYEAVKIKEAFFPDLTLDYLFN
nr:MAG TPA: SOS-response transcriptional repressor [Caudoviricetes sp.]